MSVFRVSKLVHATVLILSELPNAVLRRMRIRQIRQNQSWNQSISVVVNGPSLDLKRLPSDSELFCVNQFCLSDEFEKRRPKFYMFLDPRYADKSSHDSSFYKAVEALNKKTIWSLVLFIPRHFTNSIAPRVDNANIQICAYELTPFPAVELPTPLRPFLYDTALMTPPASNVLVHALYIAIHLGFRNVDLHGADMNFFQGVTRSNSGALSFRRNHFYGVEDVPLDMSMTQFFQEQYQNFSAFKDLADTTRRRGIKVTNHSSSSMIDAFDIVEPSPESDAAHSSRA